MKTLRLLIVLLGVFGLGLPVVASPFSPSSIPPNAWGPVERVEGDRIVVGDQIFRVASFTVFENEAGASLPRSRLASGQRVYVYLRVGDNDEGMPFARKIVLTSGR